MTSDPRQPQDNYRAMLEQAADALERATVRLDAGDAARHEPIAVIGIGCRFPGAAGPEAFWRLLHDGVDAVTKIPSDRWDVDAYYDPDPDKDGKTYSRWGGFIPEIDLFDAEFFGISPREAQSLDPQQRLLLEVSYHALEDAAVPAGQLRDSATGVFVGVTKSEYGLQHLAAENLEHVDAYLGTGNDVSFPAGRISYCLGLQGPSLSVSTACSSSLVSVHLACQSLRQQECQLALAGGVNVMLSPVLHVNLARARMLAPDGKCKTFDAAADGYVRGEGCGMVVLKRLSDAIAAGDRIWAVLRGSAVNHDGSSSGLTVPSGRAQRALLAAALADARVEAAEVQYVEAHGTGTPLGDPIEIDALSTVLGNGVDRPTPLAIGSVKTNIGHLESAAGIAGLIKTVLAVKHGAMVPHLHLRQLSPQMRWEGLCVPTETQAFPATPPVAGVSSFGASGTNAHVVVAQAPETAAREGIRPSLHLLTLSGRADMALRETVTQMLDFLEKGPPPDLADLCYTANTGRTHHEHRLAIVAASRDELIGELRSWLSGTRRGGWHHGIDGPIERQARVAMLFGDDPGVEPGQFGELVNEHPTVQAVFAKCDAIAEPLIGEPLTRWLTPPSASPDERDRRGRDLAKFSLGLALAELWKQWGLTPVAVAGHGLGELLAACVSGMLPLQDALRLVDLRAQAHADSGSATDPMPMRQELAKVPLTPPGPAMVSSLTQSCIRDCAPWTEHADRLLETGAVPPSTLALLDDLDLDAVIEIGAPPGRAAGIRHAAQRTDLARTPPEPQRGPALQVLDSAAALYVSGINLDWSGFHAPLSGKAISLPNYPFQRSRHWLPPLKKTADQIEQGRYHLLGTRLTTPLRAQLFEARVNANRPAFLNDHRVYGQVIVPAAAYVDMAFAAAEESSRARRWELRDLEFLRPLALDEHDTRLQTVLTPDGQDGYSFEIFSSPGEAAGNVAWVLHAQGRLAELAGERADVTPADGRRELDAAPGTDLYDLYARRQIDLGPHFRWVETVQRSEDSAWGRLRAPKSPNELDGVSFHPGRLDSCFQLLAAAIPDDGADSTAYVPVSARRIQFEQGATGALNCRVDLQPQGDPAATAYVADIAVSDDHGQLVVRIEGLRIERAEATALKASTEPWRKWLYEVEWQPVDHRDDRAFADRTPQDGQLAQDIETSMQEAVEAIGGAGICSGYKTLLPELDSLSTEYVLRALTSLGLDTAPGTTLDEAACRAAAGILPAHSRLFHRMLEMLAEDGFLRAASRPDASATTWDVLKPLAGTVDAAAAAERLLEDYPASEAEIRLLLNCGPHLADVLTGRQAPLELLFGGGSGLPRQLYGSSPSAHVINRAFAAAVDRIASLRPGRPLRILEVGGGTGGTTAAVLQTLGGRDYEYHFTDVAPAFVAQASERFASNSKVHCSVLDIAAERVPGDRSADSYDLVLAANVLHATADLHGTVSNLHRWLRPGGWLLALEGTARQRCLDLTFGLTDGWWLFTDTGRRRDYPLLPVSAWQSLLGACAFENFAAWPERSDTDLRILGQAVMGARRPPSKPRWLILDNDDGLGTRLAQRLDGERLAVQCLPPDSLDSEFPRTDFNTFDEVIDLGGIQARQPAPRREDVDLRAAKRFLGIAQALTSAEADDPPRLSVITQGAAEVADRCGLWHPDQATIFGMQSVLASEHPELRSRCLDLPVGDSEDAVLDGLASVLQRASTPALLALRQGRLLAARLKSWTPGKALVQDSDAEDDVRRLISRRKGMLDQLVWEPQRQPQAGDGEVVIRVEAAGLNFLDVLDGLGELPFERGWFGGECAGRVVEAGAGVDQFQPGDPVMAVAPQSFGTFARAPAELVVALPKGLDAYNAATLPLAFLTAQVGLCKCAQLTPQDTVLIHAGAGGVGLAAVQVAQATGATVMATAGSERKRDYLRSLGIGAVFDSRSVQFSEDVLEATHGRGVQVLLNSLAGEFIPAGLTCLSEGGRFVELGKTGIWTEREILAERPDVQYHVVALEKWIQAERSQAQSLVRSLAQQVASGVFRPLPHHLFPADNVIDAFRRMQQARHIGKIVIVPPGGGAGRAGNNSHDSRIELRDDRSYLISGGLGGLGLLTASWMVERGARQLVLIGRKPPTPSVEAELDRLRSDGAQIFVVRADVGDFERLGRALSAFDSLLPIAGVVHSAGKLDDGMLTRQSWSRFEKVLRPKVHGTWNLHRLTLNHPVEFFVMYSSAAALIGPVGQANHAAANAYLDAFSHFRRGLGLPALSIDWGPWSEVGAAAERGIDRDLREQGRQVISPQQGLQILEALLASDCAQVAVLPADALPENLVDLQIAAGHTSPGPRQDASPGGTRPVASDPLPDFNAYSDAERRELLTVYLQRQAGRILGRNLEVEIDRRRPLSSLGLDSLMAVELRNVLSQAFQCRLPSTLLFDYPSIGSLTDHIAREVFEWPAEPRTQATDAVPPVAPPEAAAVSGEADIDNLSTAEVAELLARKLESLKAGDLP